MKLNARAVVPSSTYLFEDENAEKDEGNHAARGLLLEEEEEKDEEEEPQYR